MRNSSSWTYMDKQVTELSRSQQQQPRTHNFFDLDDDFERDNAAEPLSFDSLRPTHKYVPSHLTVGGGEKVGMSNGADLVSEIDRKIKEHIDNVLYAVDGLSARVTQLETRMLKLENTIDDLKEFVEYNHGRTDGKLRELENILREVEGGVKDLRDKQQIAEAQLQLAKLQVSKGNPQLGKQSSASEADSTRQDISFVPQQSYQLSPDPVSCPQQQPGAHHSSVPQNLQRQSPLPAPVATAPQLPIQLPQNVMPSISPQLTPETSHQRYLIHSTQQSQLSSPVSYQPQQPAPPEITNQQYHISSTQQSQPPPPALPQSYQMTSLETTNQQYQVTPTQQSQPPPPPAPYQPYQPTPQPPISQLSQPPQFHPPPSGTVYAQAHSPLSHQHEEVPYLPSQSMQKSSQPSGGFFPPQQFYDGPKQQIHDQHPNRPYSEFPSGYLQPPDDSNLNIYRYGASPFSTGTSNTKPLQPSPPPLVPRSGSSTSQLPTAKILPQALPTASVVESGSPSGGSTNRVPVDDVVDKVVAMGFRRDLVRATVRKLTENGQSVDLNVVLDKLMNNG